MGAPPEDWRKHLGRKVSIRYRLHDDPEHPFSEAIGVVLGFDDDAGRADVRIMTKRGEVVSVRASDVVAASLFPTK